MFNLWGRNQEDYKICYSGVMSTNFYEPMPIITKKFSEFLSIIFQEPTKYVWGRECMIAEIIRILYMKYNENRHVCCDVNYADMSCNGTFNTMLYCWEDLVKRNFDDLMPIVDKMKEYIDSKK